MEELAPQPVHLLIVVAAMIGIQGLLVIPAQLRILDILRVIAVHLDIKVRSQTVIPIHVTLIIAAATELVCQILMVTLSIVVVTPDIAELVASSRIHAWVIIAAAMELVQMGFVIVTPDIVELVASRIHAHQILAAAPPSAPLAQ